MLNNFWEFFLLNPKVLKFSKNIEIFRKVTFKNRSIVSNCKNFWIFFDIVEISTKCQKLDRAPKKYFFRKIYFFVILYYIFLKKLYRAHSRPFPAARCCTTVMSRLAKLCARFLGNFGFSIGISDVTPHGISC